MTRIINVAGNSGSGKSIIAFNLGVALAQKGRDVLLIDANIYNPDILHYANMDSGAYLNDYLSGHKTIDEIINYHASGLKVISALPEEYHDETKMQKLNEAVLNTIGKAEIVIVDTFSNSPAMSHVLSNTDETLFVTNDDFASIIKAKDFVNHMENRGINVSGIILNRRRKETDARHVSAITGRRVLAQMPHDEKITDSVNMREAFIITHPDERISKIVAELAGLLDTQNGY